MARLDDIAGKGPDHIEVPTLPWLEGAIKPGFIRGGVYLLAGEPGIGKTTLAIQVLGDFAKRAIKVLYLSTEQGLVDLKRAVQSIHGVRNDQFPREIRDNFFFDDTVEGIDSLSPGVRRRVRAGVG